MNPVLLVTASLVAIFTVAMVAVYRRFPVLLIYRSKVHLQTSFDAINDPIAIIGSEHRLLRVNNAYARLVSLPFSRILGSPCYSVLRQRTSPCGDCVLREVVDARKNAVISNSVHPNNPEGVVTISLFPFSGKPGYSGDAVEHIRDITELARLRRNLEEQNRILEENAKRLKDAQVRTNEELELARQIQLGIMPQHVPEVPGLRILAAYHPIQAVGGDIYDFIPFSPKKIGIFVGDASGHGLASAFVSTISKMALYSHTKRELAVNDLLTKMNSDHMSNIRSGHYLTCFWGILDLESGTITCARAGHPKPVLITREGFLRSLDPAGTFIGILEAPQFEQKTFRVSRGDRIYFFTDGVYEVMHRNGDSLRTLGLQEFKNLLLRCNRLSLEEVIPAVERQLSHYTYEDDYTLIVTEIG